MPNATIDWSWNRTPPAPHRPTLRQPLPAGNHAYTRKPLPGPYEAATGFAATLTPERTLAVGPREGEVISVDVPTHVSAVLRLESGAFATLTTSFEARGQYESALTIHGSEGMLALPDANHFG